MVSVDASSVGTEGGLPLLCSPQEAASLRRRRERPAEVGQYVLLGLAAVSGGSAVAFSATGHLTLAWGPLVFAVLLVGLAVLLRTLIRREREMRPVEAVLWPDGVELLLANGDVRAELWNTPNLALEIYVLPDGRRAVSQRLLVWKNDGRIPPCELSEKGFDALTRAAKEHGLRIDTYRWGRRRREVLAYEIRRESTKTVHVDLPDASA